MVKFVLSVLSLASVSSVHTLTCVLSKLVHGLQVDDVRRELSIHLS